MSGAFSSPEYRITSPGLSSRQQLRLPVGRAAYCQGHELDSIPIVAQRFMLEGTLTQIDVGFDLWLAAWRVGVESRKSQIFDSASARRLVDQGPGAGRDAKCYLAWACTVKCLNSE
jgi:hypothetical protein